jgi:hypothetical protein
MKTKTILTLATAALATAVVTRQPELTGAAIGELTFGFNAGMEGQTSLRCGKPNNCEGNIFADAGEYAGNFVRLFQKGRNEGWDNAPKLPTGPA